MPKKHDSTMMTAIGAVSDVEDRARVCCTLNQVQDLPPVELVESE